MLNYLFTVQYDRFVWIFNNMFNTKVKDAVTIFFQFLLFVFNITGT